MRAVCEAYMGVSIIGGSYVWVLICEILLFLGPYEVALILEAPTPGGADLLPTHLGLSLTEGNFRKQALPNMARQRSSSSPLDKLSRPARANFVATTRRDRPMSFGGVFEVYGTQTMLYRNPGPQCW